MTHKSNTRKVVVHALAWVAAFFINLILIPGYSIDPQETLLSWLAYMVIFYVNYFLLIPRLFLRRRTVLYVFTALAVLGISFLTLRYRAATLAERHTSELVDELNGYEDVRESFERKNRMQ